MDIEIVRIGIQVGQFAITSAIGVYLYWERKSDRTNRRITALEKRHNEELKALQAQISDLDGRLKQAIGHADLKPIFERMNSMDKQLGEISGKLHTLDLIHEYLMNKNGGGK